MDAAAPDPCLGIPGDAGVAPGHMAGPAAFCHVSGSWLQTLGCEMKLTVLEKGNATWGRPGLYMQVKNHPRVGKTCVYPPFHWPKRPIISQGKQEERSSPSPLCLRMKLDRAQVLNPPLLPLQGCFCHAGSNSSPRQSQCR